MAPAKVGGRAGMKFLNVGMSMMTGALSKVMGAELLRDVQTFVAAMDTMFGGFRNRADATYRLLQAPGTAFLVVAAPERDALREAAYFVERLAAEDMPLAGLVLNRVHGSGAAQLTAERALAAAEALEDALAEDADSDGGDGSATSRPSRGRAANSVTAADVSDSPAGKADPCDTRRSSADRGRERLAAGLLRLHAERMQVVARERAPATASCPCTRRCRWWTWRRCPATYTTWRPARGRRRSADGSRRGDPARSPGAGGDRQSAAA